jgi:uncharacterized membrane protein
MLISKHSLKRTLSNVPKWVPISLGIVALLGFADATYLTIEHFSNLIPPCTLSSCEIVLTSKYSTMFGIPDPLLGSIYYFMILVLVFAYFDSKKEVLLRVALFGTTAGFLFSLWLVYLQAFVLHAYCQYCLGSAASSTALFIIAVIALAKYRSPEISTELPK